MKKEKSCGVIVFRIHNGERLYLLIKQLKNSKWGFPKGHRYFWETELQTAMREVREESGVKPNVIKGFRELVTYTTFKQSSKTVVFFLGEVFDDKVKIQEGEIADYTWLNFKDAHEKISFKDFKHMLVKAEEFVNSSK